MFSIRFFGVQADIPVSNGNQKSKISWRGKPSIVRGVKEDMRGLPGYSPGGFHDIASPKDIVAALEFIKADFTILQGKSLLNDPDPEPPAGVVYGGSGFIKKDSVVDLSLPIRIAIANQSKGLKPNRLSIQSK